jgi:hypothetical protein
MAIRIGEREFILVIISASDLSQVAEVKLSSSSSPTQALGLFAEEVKSSPTKFT